MTPTSEYGADARLAAQIASEAGRLLVDLRTQLDDPGADPKEVKDEGDRRSHDLIMAALHQAVPLDAVLSEEGSDDEARLSAARVWIVDPLDGTREFGEPPRTDWAVHVALVVGGQPVAGAVALPALDFVASSDMPMPALPAIPAKPRVVVSRTRPPAGALAVSEALDGELVEMGSAGAKAMAVVRGEVDVYAHSGGQYEWDSCAPVAVAIAAGLHVSRADGSPLVYNNANPYLPDLLICRQELAAMCIETLVKWI